MTRGQVHRPGYVTYTDTDYANNYDVDFSGDGMLVRSEDTDSHRMGSQPFQPAAVCKELRSVMNDAHDIMSAALAEWSRLSEGCLMKEEPLVDLHARHIAGEVQSMNRSDS